MHRKLYYWYCHFSSPPKNRVPAHIFAIVRRCIVGEPDIHIDSGHLDPVIYIFHIYLLYLVIFNSNLKNPPYTP